ncbi:Phosphatase 1B [Fasciolopsis buskii]|uniref:Phosphatase 1B n=1 Tax=Fasciolopsis buskii TaxID=27845 RepID=A0A8E0VFC5_9TREM|nr:Phosphatase 1B [Fasciolopsis buski]
MGAFLEKPKTDKFRESGAGNGLRYGLCSMQGWRIEMEDAHVARVELPPPFKSWSYFGVFDGHAGARVSERCAAKLLDTILNTDEFKKIAAQDNAELDLALIKLGIINGFLAFDRELALEDREEKSGSTAVVAFITPTHIIMANCGDSRAMVVRDDKPFLATEDHKPYLPTERKRISEAGGQVMLSRVNGSLAVSRSLGDFEYKQLGNRGATEQLVSPEPDLFVVTRNKERDQLLILACDGIWDVFENDALANYVLQRIRCVASLTDVCAEILDTSLHKGSRDNMSVLLVALDNAPTLDPEAARKDVELDKAISSIVMAGADGPDLHDCANRLTPDSNEADDLL